MIGKLDDYLRFHESALSLRSTRQELLYRLPQRFRRLAAGSLRLRRRQWRQCNKY